MKLAALIFGDEDRPKTAAGKSPEPGQIVRSVDGSVYRVASKIAGPDGVVVKLANLQGKPVQTPPNFRPVGLAVARFASWLRYHLAYQKDFDLYVNAYIEQYNNQHKDNPLPYPIGQDGKPFRWANFFQKKISPKLYVRGHGGTEDQQAVKDDIIHEMLFNTLGERRVLDQFAAKAKKLGVNRQNAATKLTDFLISTFMYRVDEMQNKLNARSPEEEISMWAPGSDDSYSGEDQGDKNILEQEQYGVGETEFQSAEARKDVARFRESFRKWLAHTAGPKASEAFILMFDIFWRLLQQDESGEIKRNELQDEWMEKTGLSFGSFKDYFSRLPEMMESFITSHATELGENSIFVDLMETIRAERSERERKERRQKQKARPAMVSSLKIAEGIEEDVAEAQKAAVSPMKVADGIGGDFAQAISNSENPDVVDPDIKQPTKSVPEAAKQADYTQQDWEQDEAAEAWLDTVRDAENEAKRAFMQDTDMQKEAQNAEMTMEQLWAEIGDEFTNEYWAPRTASAKTAGLVRGDQLTPEMRRQVEDAFMYRWTKENKRRGSVYHCDKCDVVNNPFQGSNAEGHQHPTIPLQTDAEWLHEHAFYFTNAGKLQPRRHAVPAYLAPEPEPEGLFASVAHKFAMEKTLKQADFACCGGISSHKTDCSVKGTHSVSKESGVFDRYMTPNQMVQEFNRPGGQGERLREDYPVEEKEPHITTKMRRGLGDPAIPRKEGMLGHDFNDADGQAIGNETEPDTGRYLHESDTTELKQRRVAGQEIWECMDCGAKGELDPRGGGCAACGSQALSPLRESPDPVAEKEKHQIFRETSPEKYQQNLDALRERQRHEEPAPPVVREKEVPYVAPRQRALASDKTAQGSGGTTVTFQNQNVTSPNSPNKGEPMAVPEAIDQAAGPHSPNAPSTAPRTPGITPKIVNVPPGTEGEMGNVASAKTADAFEDLFGGILADYACPHCQSVNVDVTPTEDGYDIYCEDCEQVTHSHGGATPGVSGFHATEPELVDPDLEMEPEEAPFDEHEAAHNPYETYDRLKKDYDDKHEVVYPEGGGAKVVEKKPEEKKADALFQEESLPPSVRLTREQALEWCANPATDTMLVGRHFGDRDFVEINPEDDMDAIADGMYDEFETWALNAIKSKHGADADALFEEQPLADVTDLDVLIGLPEERKAEWLKAHGWSPDEEWHGASWWMQKPMWSKDGYEEDIPYQDTDEAIEKEVELMEKEDERIESKGIGCPQCGAVMNNAEEGLCGQCRAEGAEDMEDPFDKMGAGSNSGDDDARGAGDNWREEFYEHRTKGLSSDGMLSGMKEAAPAVAPPVAQAPNVQQNMNLVRPQVQAPGTPGATMAIMPGQDEEEGGIKRHTVEPELPNAKYHMQGSLVAAEERRLAAEFGLEVDPEAEANPEMYTAEEKWLWIPPQGAVCRNCEQPKPDLKWNVFDEFSDLKPGREGKDLEGWFCKDCALDVAQDI